MSKKHPNMGGNRIHQVVLARSAALKFKALSTSLVVQRRRNADKGDFQVTHVDEPVAASETRRVPLPVESTSSPRRSTVSTVITPYSLAFKNQTPQSTYRLEPTERFREGKVKTIIEETFNSELKDLSYSPEVCSRMTKKLCDMIQQKVKNLQFSRYKCVTVIFLGQKSGQSARVASRCVWDTRFDNYAQFVYEGSKDVFAIGTVYGIYHE
ncbi:tctex1 domain-containing protein 1-like [Actinia tenebrosa]|uniref:Tctex1 domain-containing protein 1-like n=1 Tax=Actinia tenebrosa TaxID=6105 RepID=A0A6P8IR89_ACTTE|nr:tctex1 domain-containing protein 1-like [Actinia tenebrosa]